MYNFIYIFLLFFLIFYNLKSCCEECNFDVEDKYTNTYYKKTNEFNDKKKSTEELEKPKFDNTKILTKDITQSKEYSDLQPATWEKYHCHLIVNQQMQCIKCQQNNLYIKLKENILYCPKCHFSSEPTMILWTCISCGQEFTTNAKIYNPYEYKPISISLKTNILKMIMTVSIAIIKSHDLNLSLNERTT